MSEIFSTPTVLHQSGGGERNSFNYVEFIQLAASVWLICTEQCQQFYWSVFYSRTPRHLTLPVLGGGGCLFIDVTRHWCLFCSWTLHCWGCYMLFGQGCRYSLHKNPWIHYIIITAVVVILSLSSVNSSNKWVWLKGLSSETMMSINTDCPTGSTATAHPEWHQKTNNIAKCVRLGWKSLSCPSINPLA